MGTMYERLGGRVDKYGSDRSDWYQGKLFAYDERELERYERGWSRMMINIWREIIIQMNITDSGALGESLSRNWSRLVK